MRQLLEGLWQISPLTDLSVPQNDLTFPAPLSSALPDTLSEQQIAAQEWHLMHDFVVDEHLLNHKVIELVVAGCEHYAEVRLNGVAMFDCDGSAMSYRRNIRPYLQGGNRVEILFLEQEEELWFDEEDEQGSASQDTSENATQTALGLSVSPYLQFSEYVQLERFTIEQIWHPVGGCELKVGLAYKVEGLGLVSAKVKFNGMTLTLPLDLRSSHTSALFQVDAPVEFEPECLKGTGRYSVEIEMDGYHVVQEITLSPESDITTVHLSDIE